MESENNTPWLQSATSQHDFGALQSSLQTDCVVVGGGIAGCMTAYFMLQETDKNVVLVDANKIAHGATGHNAGQIDVFFEKPVQELIKTYGEDLTRGAYQAMFDARGRLEEVITKMNWAGRYAKYIGYNVYTTRQQVLDVLEQLTLFDTMGLEINEFFVCEEMKEELAIPHIYNQYCNRIPASEGETYIGSHTLGRLGFEATHYATVNSAELCYSIMQYLLKTYSARFQVFEHTPIGEIQYENDICTLKTHAGHILTAHDVVLATNAYQSYTINTKKDNHHVHQVRGYMAGYYVDEAKCPLTVGYEPPGSGFTEGYYYQSVRKYNDSVGGHTLVTVGGPDETTDHRKHHFPDDLQAGLDKHVSQYYGKKTTGTFYWWGDMGYTETGMRKIGPHPEYPHIRYNLGCNGVGILGSIHGGRKIAQQMEGKGQGESVFDVKIGSK